METAKTLKDHLVTTRGVVSVAEFDDSAAIAPQLRKDVVLIGANVGLGGDPGDFPIFKNFHAQKSGGDSKLRKALGLSLETLYIPMGGTTRALWDLLVNQGLIPAEQRVFHRGFRGGPHFNGKPVENLRHYSGAVNMVDAVQALLAQPSLP